MAKIVCILKGVILFMMLALGSCTKWNYHDGGLSYGIHDCSMWEYLHTQPYDWDSTIIMIEHAGLKELFEGQGEHEQITFFGVTNLSILNYMLQNEYKKVTDIPVEETIDGQRCSQGPDYCQYRRESGRDGCSSVKRGAIYMDSSRALHGDRRCGRSFFVYQNIFRISQFPGFVNGYSNE